MHMLAVMAAGEALDEGGALLPLHEDGAARPHVHQRKLPPLPFPRLVGFYTKARAPLEFLWL